MPLEQTKNTNSRDQNMLVDNEAQNSARMTPITPKTDRIQVEVQINHQGEANRARSMP